RGYTGVQTCALPIWSPVPQRRDLWDPGLARRQPGGLPVRIPAARRGAQQQPQHFVTLRRLLVLAVAMLAPSSAHAQGAALGPFRSEERRVGKWAKCA